MALTADDRKQFIEKGYVVVRNTFPADVAAEWRASCFERLKCDPADPATWPSDRVHMTHTKSVLVEEFAPRCYEAMCELVGGPEKFSGPPSWSDAFIVNFKYGADAEWQPPSPALGGWHKDGDFFRHFLDSSEQGLLPIVLWSDIKPKGGGTFAAIDSIRPVAKYFVDHPEGIEGDRFNARPLVLECSEFVEITGNAGDVYILHPFILHTISTNSLGIPRLITNPPAGLAEPLRFDRPNEEDHSLVEQAILNALGVKSLAFQPARERLTFVPERARRAAAAAEAEKSGGVATGFVP